MCFSQWKQHSMALAEEVSRKLKALSRILVHWRHIQTSFLPLPPTRSLSPFSQPNSMTHSYNHCLTCIILPLSPSITLISKHLYPEVNPNLPYIFHSHGWHRTGGKNTSMHTHTHTDSHTLHWLLLLWLPDHRPQGSCWCLWQMLLLTNQSSFPAS